MSSDLASEAAPFEASYSALKMASWILLAAPLIAASGWMTREGLAGGSLAATIIGGCGLVFFGGAGLAFLRCMIDRRVQLRIDDAGLFLRPHADKPIPLHSIRSSQIATGMIRLLLYKPSKFPIDGAVRRFIFRINGAQARPFFGDAWIWTAHYDCSADQIFDAINQHIVPTPFEQHLAARGGVDQS